MNKNMRVLLLRGVLGVALLAVTSAPAAAQMTPIFRANFSASAYPNYGFGMEATREGTHWISTNRPGAGPRGEDAAEIALRYVGDMEQHYTGWIDQMPPIPQGATRYVRLRIRLVTPIAYTSLMPNGRWATKMVILGDGGSSSDSRLMWNLRNSGLINEPIFRLEKNIDGGATRIETPVMPSNQWISAQWKIRTSSTPSTADGQSFLYLGAQNSSESTPTYASGNFAIDNSGMGRTVCLGCFGDAARTDTRVVYQFSAFEIDDQFDPNWNIASGTSSGPTVPTNLRLTSSATVPVGITSALLWLRFRVRRKRAQEQGK